MLFEDGEVTNMDVAYDVVTRNSDRMTLIRIYISNRDSGVTAPFDMTVNDAERFARDLGTVVDAARNQQEGRYAE